MSLIINKNYRDLDTALLLSYINKNNSENQSIDVSINGEQIAYDICNLSNYDIGNYTSNVYSITAISSSTIYPFLFSGTLLYTGAVNQTITQFSAHNLVNFIVKDKNKLVMLTSGIDGIISHIVVSITQVGNSIFNLYAPVNVLTASIYTAPTSNVSVWQGIRALANNNYLFCGTYSGTGVIYIGDAEVTGSNFVYMTYLETGINNISVTSLYGPNYINENLYQMVGIYRKTGDSNNYAFYYSGGLTGSDVSNAANYHNITTSVSYNIIFAHSIINNLCVINSGNVPPAANINTYSYIYNITYGSTTLISIAGYLTTTTYGIYNIENDGIYTIVGGCGLSNKNIESIIKQNGIIVPYGYGFIMDYDSTNNTFLTPTLLYVSSSGVIMADIIVPNTASTDLLIHIQGIGYYNNMYVLSVDTVSNTGNGLSTGYYVTMYRENNKFVIRNVVEINNGYTANSVANNVVCGIYNNSLLLPYQAIIQ